MGADNQPHVDGDVVTKAGQARPTLADVAKRAGVSGSTASIAFSGVGSISEATRSRVLRAADELRYFGPDPRARSLRQGRSGIVGVVLEDRVLHSFRDPMTIAVLDGISQELDAEHGGMLLLTSTGVGESTIQSAVFDAAVFLGCSPHLRRSIEVMRQRNIPMVAIEGQPFDGVLSVALDNREASARLAAHLHGLGHRAVATVTLPMDARRELLELDASVVAGATTAVSIDRLAGAREVYPALGGFVAANSSSDEGYAAGLRVLGAGGGSGRPTAIMAQSDLLAVGVIRAAESLGLRVPADLTVVGFDGARIEGLSDHDLTTMVQPATEKGRAAGRAVTELLAGEHPPDVAFTCDLHIGTTSGPPHR
ncbi:LacI family DNA-binding transcriptional regulator [Subtercola boreus]|uniref:LacI family DNA-binding transcriptional regulator n=1 Tax=Subtercola boreus TaxID=120213 RepID=UPI00209C1C70|nr:LacI family DNA-binding transcriptional regulator [Subtercola boreus]